jgi:transcription-repair coupling factor (superfamily II helicase)
VWEKTMRKVKENVEEVAKELLELFAKRKMNK